MDDLLSVAKQLENLNPITPAGKGSAARSARSQSGTQAKSPGQTPPEARGVRGVNSIRVEAVLSRLLGKLDSRILGLMAAMPVSKASPEARMELSFLVQLRDALIRHVGEVPKDVSICETLNEAIQNAEESLTDLQSGSLTWCLRMAAFLRERCSMAQALGSAPTGMREKLKALKNELQLCEGAVSEEMSERLFDCFVQLRANLQAHEKNTDLSLLHHTVGKL